MEDTKKLMVHIDIHETFPLLNFKLGLVYVKFMTKKDFQKISQKRNWL